MKVIVLLLGISTFLVFTSGFVEDDYSSSSHKFLANEERKTNLFKRHAAKTIRSEDGDIIDCIDIYKQPAFNHPALSNHTIQMAPANYDPTTKKKISRTESKSWRGNEDSAITVTSQLWHKEGTFCPKGTIPIRRIRKRKDFPKTNRNHTYRRKIPKYHVHGTGDVYIANHSLVVLLTEGYSYSGAKGDIKVWTPYVESNDDYSTSFVSLRSGAHLDFEEVESGWAVNPSVYGDKQTRLFVYWTVDASRTTGCFDLTCPGFVQTNSDIALGAAIYPISNPTGLPYQITIYIYKDEITSNWWVQYGESINIGYWPPELFSLLKYQAVMVQWGGEVYSPRVGTHPHTATGMGSGQFSDNVLGTSGSIKGIRIEEHRNELKFPEWVNCYSDEYECYDYFYQSDYVEDPEFYYGGPGSYRNPYCP